MSAAADAVPYVLLGNGRVARDFLAGLDAGGQPSLVVLNEAAKQREGDAIREICAERGVAVREWSPEVRAALVETLRGGDAPWLLSVYFAHLLDAEVLDAAGGRAVNLHPALLPWCRGAHTNVWPLVEGCPAGVTLHAMVPRVDAGSVVAQRPVEVRPWDTAATLYDRLEAEALALLRDAWPGEVVRAWPGTPQAEGGCYHRTADLRALDDYDLDAHPEARAFYDLLRARSFPPHRGLRIRVGGRVVEAVLTLGEHRDD